MKILVLLLSVAISFFSFLASSKEGQSTIVETKAPLFECVRSVYQVSNLEILTKSEVEKVINLLNTTYEDDVDYDALMASCNEIKTTHLQSYRNGRYKVSRYFDGEGVEENEDQPKRKAWEAFIAELSDYSTGAWNLRHIVKPMERCETLKEDQVGLWLVGAARRVQSCVNTAGYSFVRFEAAAGIGQIAGCSVIGLGTNFNYWFKQNPDDWSYSVNLLEKN